MESTGFITEIFINRKNWASITLREELPDGNLKTLKIWNYSQEVLNQKKPYGDLLLLSLLRDALVHETNVKIKYEPESMIIEEVSISKDVSPFGPYRVRFDREELPPPL